jgi:hypothetical protein
MSPAFQLVGRAARRIGRPGADRAATTPLRVIAGRLRGLIGGGAAKRFRLPSRRIIMAVSQAQRPHAPESIATSFAQVLHADAPDVERESRLALYAWLVGRWEMEVTTITEDGATHPGRGEIHAGWILQGRAIQDVWMIPRLAERKPGIEQLAGAGNWYGTTLRIYDPNLDAWRILWNDPATNFFSQQIGRARGRDVVQEGPDPRGGSMRWTFAEIEPNSFHWTAERAADDKNWRREVDIRARRA